MKNTWRVGFIMLMAAGLGWCWAQEASPAPVQNQSDSTELPGWKITRGSWKIVSGILQNEVQQGLNARIESADSVNNFTLTTQICIEQAHYGEFQFRGLRFGINQPKKGVWHDLAIQVKGDSIIVQLDGEDVSLGEDSPQTPKPGGGPIAFYVTKNGQMKLRDLKLIRD